MIGVLVWSILLLLLSADSASAQVDYWHGILPEPMTYDGDGYEQCLAYEQSGRECLPFVSKTCFYLEYPQSSEYFHTIWQAATPIALTDLFCEVTGGTSVVITLKNDKLGTGLGVAGVSSLTCDVEPGEGDYGLSSNTLMNYYSNLDLELGTVTGSVSELTVCWRYRPLTATQYLDAGGL